MAPRCPRSGFLRVDSHLERFAGLHSAALALLEHLAGDYDVEVHGDPVHARDLLLDA